MHILMNLVHVKNSLTDCFVHSDGRVYTYHSVWKKFVLHKTYIDKDGYIRLSVRGRNFVIHQLLAMAFIPNPDGFPTVDHIDRNKLNNSIGNLRWADAAIQNSNRDTHKLSTEERKSRCSFRSKTLREQKKAMGLCYLKRSGKWGWFDESERRLSRGNRYTKVAITK